jgi:hypothetical protein
MTDSHRKQAALAQLKNRGTTALSNPMTPPISFALVVVGGLAAGTAAQRLYSSTGGESSWILSPFQLLIGAFGPAPTLALGVLTAAAGWLLFGAGKRLSAPWVALGLGASTAALSLVAGAYRAGAGGELGSLIAGDQGAAGLRVAALAVAVIFAVTGLYALIRALSGERLWKPVPAGNSSAVEGEVPVPARTPSASAAELRPAAAATLRRATTPAHGTVQPTEPSPRPLAAARPGTPARPGAPEPADAHLARASAGGQPSGISIIRRGSGQPAGASEVLDVAKFDLAQRSSAAHLNEPAAEVPGLEDSRAELGEVRPFRPAGSPRVAVPEASPVVAAAAPAPMAAAAAGSVNLAAAVLPGLVPSSSAAAAAVAQPLSPVPAAPAGPGVLGWGDDDEPSEEEDEDDEEDEEEDEDEDEDEDDEDDEDEDEDDEDDDEDDEDDDEDEEDEDEDDDEDDDEEEEDEDEDDDDEDEEEDEDEDWGGDDLMQVEPRRVAAAEIAPPRVAAAKSPTIAQPAASSGAAAAASKAPALAQPGLFDDSQSAPAQRPAAASTAAASLAGGLVAAAAAVVSAPAEQRPEPAARGQRQNTVPGAKLGLAGQLEAALKAQSIKSEAAAQASQQGAPAAGAGARKAGGPGQQQDSAAKSGNQSAKASGAQSSAPAAAHKGQGAVSAAPKAAAGKPEGGQSPASANDSAARNQAGAKPAAGRPSVSGSAPAQNSGNQNPASGTLQPQPRAANPRGAQQPGRPAANRNEPTRAAAPRSGNQRSDERSAANRAVEPRSVPSGEARSAGRVRHKPAPKPVPGLHFDINDRERLIYESGLLFLEQGRVAVSMLQKGFGLDFDVSTEVLDVLQQRGLIGPYLGGKSRDILMSAEAWKSSAAPR